MPTPTTASATLFSQVQKTCDTTFTKTRADGTDKTKAFQAVSQLKPTDEGAYRTKLSGNQRIVMDLREPHTHYTVQVGRKVQVLDLTNLVPDADRNAVGFKARLILDTECVNTVFELRGFKLDWTTDAMQCPNANGESSFSRVKGTGLEQSPQTTSRKTNKGQIRGDFSSDYLQRYKLKPAVVEAKVNQLVADPRFAMQYQPIFDTQKAPKEATPKDQDAKADFLKGLRPTLAGAEALLPRIAAQENEVSYFPDEIMNIVDQKDQLAHQFGQKIIGSSLEQLAKWNAEKMLPEGFVLSINLSATQIKAGNDLVSFVRNQLSTHGINPAQVQFELTESPVLEPTQANIDTINSLHELGCKIALDDLAPPSSEPKGKIELTKLFHVDTVKLDRSLLWNPKDPKADPKKKSLEFRAFLKTVQQQLAVGAKNPTPQLVAEGVEDAKGIALTKEAGVHLTQGWAYGAKVDAAEYGKLYLQDRVRLSE